MQDFHFAIPCYLLSSFTGGALMIRLSPRSGLGWMLRRRPWLAFAFPGVLVFYLLMKTIRFCYASFLLMFEMAGGHRLRSHTGAQEYYRYGRYSAVTKRSPKRQLRLIDGGAAQRAVDGEAPAGLRGAA